MKSSPGGLRNEIFSPRAMSTDTYAAKSPAAAAMTIDGPAGPIHLDILLPPGEIRGVYLHIHGGGWIMGGSDTRCQQLELVGHEAGMVAVSFDYRLGPEHGFGAAVEDCLAVASWLVDRAQDMFGSSWLSIGGELEGANLAALTLLRLRDAGRGGAFRAANLLFGCFDLSRTPGVRPAHHTPPADRGIKAPFDSAVAAQCDLRAPAISSLYADLRGLPAALFTVGSIDPLLDDSVFMYTQWQVAGNHAQIAIFPGGAHGFSSFTGELAHTANLGMAYFLARAHAAHR